MDNISLTQRIVGAIVILSLAIIFIPALLETDLIDTGKVIESPIPEVPREISTIVFQLNESNGKFEGEGLTFQGDDEDTKQLTPSQRLGHEVTAAIEASEREVILTPEPVEENKAPPISSEETQVGQNTVARTKVLANKVLDDGKQHSWMLQLASFKDEQNAFKLRDKLRKKQYVTHVSERKFSSGSIWRVRIGPILNKEKVVKIQAILAKELGMKGLIVRRR